MSEKIVVHDITLTDPDDYQTAMRIVVNGKRVFDIQEGETEDMSFGRNLNDLYKLSGLLQEMYEYGKQGKQVDFIAVEAQSWEEYCSFDRKK